MKLNRRLQVGRIKIMILRKVQNYLRAVESYEKSVSNKFNVLFHQVMVHANELNWESFCKKFLFNNNSILDN